MGIGAALCLCFYTIGIWEPQAPEAPSADEAYRRLVSMGIESKDFPQRMLHAATAGDTDLLNLLAIVLHNNIPQDEQHNTPLHLCAYNGHTEACGIWPAHHHIYNQPNASGQSPLHLAAMAGHTACVELLLSKGAEADRPDLKGYTPLLYAAERGHPECVKLLLGAGASVYTRNAQGKTLEELAEMHPQVLAILPPKQQTAATIATHANKQDEQLPTYNLYSGEPIAKAIRNKDAAEVARLIANGLSLDYRENHKLPLIHIAIEEAQPEILEILLQAGAAPDTTAYNGEPALHTAAASGAAACVKLLLAHKANPHAKHNGSTALIPAICSGNIECVELLIQAGLSVNETTIHGKTPLICAAEIGNDAMIDLLLKHGADVNATPRNNSALLTAVQGKHTACVRTLLNACADITYTHRFYRTALHMAAEADSADCIPMLVQAHGYVDARDKLLRTPLHYAAAHGHVKSMEALLGCGANPNTHDRYNNTALHFAAEKNFPRCIAPLCNAGADPNEKQSNGLTALHIATKQGHTECVAALLECGADPTIPNVRGETARDLAIKYMHPACVKLLAMGTLKHKGISAPDTASLCAAIEANDAEGIILHIEAGITPTAEILHTAAAKGQTDALVKLLTNRNGANYVNHNNETLLHTAARAGHDECVKALIRLNLPLNVKNDEGKTAIDLAGENNHTACVELLNNAQKLAERGCTPANYNESLIIMAERGDHINLTRLISLGADVNYANQEGNTALHVAASHKSVTCTKKLLDADARADVLNIDKKTPLMIATELGLSSNVRALLAKGAKVDFMGGIDTAATLAVKNNQKECLQILLDKGANVNSQDGKQKSLLLLATIANNHDIMQVLLERGADVNAVVNDEPLLFTAIQAASPHTLQMLLKLENLNIHYVTADGRTAMHVAAQYGNVTAITLLYKAGLRLDCCDHEGQTIAHYAARAGQAELLRQIIAVGIPANTQDKRGNTPLYYAEQEGHQECVEMLRPLHNTPNEEDDIKHYEGIRTPHN